MFRKFRKHTFLIIIIISFVFYMNKTLNFSFKIISDEIRNFNENNEGNNIKCSPFNLNRKNFFVKFYNQTYPKSLPLYLNQTINFECLNSSKNIKLILLWTPFYEKVSYGYGLGLMKPFQVNQCPISNCEITNDKSRLNQSDFVLVHMRNTLSNLPKYRPSKQRWIFNLYESPIHSPSFKKYRRFFNYTSTYRLDSDFPRLNGAYKRFLWKENLDFENEFENFHNKKTNKFAVAVISNCGASSKRIKLINELKKYINVDIYGKCGILCTNQSCKERLANEYKFYFSFENSLCKDYITEKLFEILRYPIIPVVLGLGNYEHIVSFIFYCSKYIN
jgi:alpha-1,3-fucosyltransferase